MARHNQRFAKPPFDPRDLHRPLTSHDDLHAEMVWRDGLPKNVDDLKTHRIVEHCGAGVRFELLDYLIGSDKAFRQTDFLILSPQQFRKVWILQPESHARTTKPGPMKGSFAPFCGAQASLFSEIFCRVAKYGPKFLDY